MGAREGGFFFVNLQLEGVPYTFPSRTMTKKKVIHILTPAVALVSALCGCSGDSVEKRPAPEILMQVGDSVLTRDMVTTLIPSGLSAADSIRMFDAIVESWVERNMLVNLAGSQLPDIEKIENMVQRYREQLLANEYRKVMAADNVHGVSAQSVQEYYDEHPDLYRLDRPLVKGIYLKVQADSPHLDELRAWIRGASDDDIDNLENYGLRGAMEYDYFGDTWIDWQTVEDHIPYRFDDPDRFVAHNTYFECEENGSLYMLRILGFMRSGDKMPLSFAEAQIREQLLEQRRGDYDRQLLMSLYSQGIDSKSIKTGAYVPIKYRKR